MWEIRDSGARISTRTADRSAAEKALAAWIERKHRPRGPTAPHELTVAQALTLYAEEHAVTVAAPERIGYAIDALDAFWGDHPISYITGPTCRRCNVAMQPGVALAQTVTSGEPDFPGGEAVTMSAGGAGKMVPCWKCPECGRSLEKGKSYE